MKRTVKETCKKEFYKSLDMLAGFISQCPGDLWHRKLGGFIFWQQLFHCLESIHYWLRLGGSPYQAQFAGKKIYPNLDQQAVDQLSRKELKEYLFFVTNQAELFFKGLTEEKLLDDSPVNAEKSLFEVLLLQIRHIQYHTGHCNSILREQGVPAVEWID